ncbi:MAG: hypothetical protein QMD71_02315 [bacterium]|nr:hypothetical protein [bacterium]
MNLAIPIIFVIFGAFLSIVFTKFLIQNGRAILEEGKKTRELIEKISELIKETREETKALITSEGDKTRKFVKELKS